MTARVVVVFVAMVLASAGSTASDGAADTEVSLFAQLESMGGASLSPDGTQIAFLSAINGRYHVVIERFSPQFSRYMVLPGEELDFDWVRWVNDDRLVVASSWSSKRDTDIYSVRSARVRTQETRLFSLSSIGQDLTYLVKPETFKKTGSRVPVELPAPQIQDDVVDWLPDDPEHILVALDANFDGFVEVRRININNGDYETVVGNFAGPAWVTDQTGTVRVGWGVEDIDGDLRAKYLNLNGDWTDVSSAAWAEAGFLPISFTEDASIAYAFGPNIDGRTVIKTLNLESGEFLETVFEHDTVDAGGIVTDDSSGRPVGISYIDDLEEIEYFDGPMRQLQKNVDAALPDSTNRIVSTSMNHRQILVLSYSDTNPGSYFLWDRDGKSLDFYADRYKDLSNGRLAPTDAVAYKARDGLEINAYLTIPGNTEAKGLPTIIMPHGGPNDRSDQSYWFISQFLAARGYAVFQPNFRGSSGYGSAFMNAGSNEWGGKMQDDVSDGAQWLVDQGLADPDRMCIVGWSYGGYAAAMGAVKTPDLFRCAASINGVMNLPALLQHNRDYAGGRLWNKEIGLEDESANSVSPYHQADAIKIPMLIIQSADDARVPKNQGSSMVKRLESLDKDVSYVEIEFGGHSMLNVSGREKILAALDEFLAAQLGEGD